jgi:hypothetical protein
MKTQTQFVNDESAVHFLNAGTSEGAKKGWQTRIGDPKAAETGESGLQHEDVAKGDKLQRHDESVDPELKKGDTYTVTGKNDWQVMAKHDRTGKPYKFGGNGLRFMTVLKK